MNKLRKRPAFLIRQNEIRHDFARQYNNLSLEQKKNHLIKYMGLLQTVPRTEGQWFDLESYLNDENELQNA